MVERDSYMAARQDVVTMEEVVDTQVPLFVDEYMTPTGPEFEIPIGFAPPPPPSPKKQRPILGCQSHVSASTSMVPVSDDLYSIFKT